MIINERPLTSFQRCQAVQAWERWQKDGRYQAHYLPASLSYAVDQIKHERKPQDKSLIKFRNTFGREKRKEPGSAGARHPVLSEGVCMWQALTTKAKPRIIFEPFVYLGDNMKQ